MVSTTASETLADLGGLLDRAATLDDAKRAGEELFGVATTLRSEPALRRVATDTSVDAEAKAEPGHQRLRQRPRRRRARRGHRGRTPSLDGVLGAGRR